MSSDYIPTLYNETGRPVWSGKRANYTSLGINKTNLIGHLEHHPEDIEGSFTICVAQGDTVLLDNDVFHSIPQGARPPLNFGERPTVWHYQDGVSKGTIPAYGTTILPILFTNMETKQRFRIKVFCIVVQGLGAGMHIGTNCGWWAESKELMIPPTYRFLFPEVGSVWVRGTWMGVD